MVMLNDEKEKADEWDDIWSQKGMNFRLSFLIVLCIIQGMQFVMTYKFFKNTRAIKEVNWFSKIMTIFANICGLTLFISWLSEFIKGQKIDSKLLLSLYIIRSNLFIISLT